MALGVSNKTPYAGNHYMPMSYVETVEIAKHFIAVPSLDERHVVTKTIMVTYLLLLQIRTETLLLRASLNSLMQHIYAVLRSREAVIEGTLLYLFWLNLGKSKTVIATMKIYIL